MKSASYISFVKLSAEFSKFFLIKLPSVFAPGGITVTVKAQIKTKTYIIYTKTKHLIMCTFLKASIVAVHVKYIFLYNNKVYRIGQKVVS